MARHDDDEMDFTVETLAEAPNGDRLIIFEDRAHPGEWRHRRKARNNRNISTSGEAFASKSNAKRALKRAYVEVFDAQKQREGLIG